MKEGLQTDVRRMTEIQIEIQIETLIGDHRIAAVTEMKDAEKKDLWEAEMHREDPRVTADRVTGIPAVRQERSRWKIV